MTLRRKVYLTVFLGLCSCLAHSNEQIISFATDPWPPYFIDSKTSEISDGAGVALVKELYSLIPNAAPSFPKVPWKRALLEVQRGEKDGIALLLETEERSKYMLFSDVIIEVPSLFYYRKDVFPSGFKWTNIDDLKGQRIGIVRGYSYGKEFDALLEKKQLDVVESSNSKQLLTMLAYGRVDIVPENSVVAAQIISDSGWQNVIATHPKAIEIDELRIGLSMRSEMAEHILQLNSAIKILRESGRIDAIARSLNTPQTPR